MSFRVAVADADAFVFDTFCAFAVGSDLKDAESIAFEGDILGLGDEEVFGVEAVADGFEAIEDDGVFARTFFKHGDAVKVEGLWISAQGDGGAEAASVSEFGFIEIRGGVPAVVAVQLDAQKMASKRDVGDGGRSFSDKSMVVVHISSGRIGGESEGVLCAFFDFFANATEEVDESSGKSITEALEVRIELDCFHDVGAGLILVFADEVGERGVEIEFRHELRIGEFVLEVGDHLFGLVEGFECEFAEAGLTDRAQFFAFVKVLLESLDLFAGFVADGFHVIERIKDLLFAEQIKARAAFHGALEVEFEDANASRVEIGGCGIGEDRDAFFCGGGGGL